ncbi:threonylcarbamoyl-AMP synthase, partial [Patescibacteria group bacterium]
MCFRFWKRKKDDMDIVKINPNIPDKKVITGAVKIIKQGGVVMYPTDTAYGLAADIESREGIEKIFYIKGRMQNKTLSLIAGSTEMASRYVEWTPVGKKLARKFWPGPLTLILESRIMNLESKICRKYIIRQGKIAVRVPDNKIARALSKKLGRPITSTSANISNHAECYSSAEFLNQAIGNKWLPDLILDAGRLKKRKL